MRSLETLQTLLISRLLLQKIQENDAFCGQNASRLRVYPNNSYDWNGNWSFCSSSFIGSSLVRFFFLFLFSYSLTKSSCIFLFHSRYPIEIDTSLKYIVIFLYQVIGLAFSACLNVTYDMLGTALLLKSKLEVDRLGNMLAQVGNIRINPRFLTRWTNNYRLATITSTLITLQCQRSSTLK